MGSPIPPKWVLNRRSLLYPLIMYLYPIYIRARVKNKTEALEGLGGHKAGHISLIMGMKGVARDPQYTPKWALCPLTRT